MSRRLHRDLERRLPESRCHIAAGGYRHSAAGEQPFRPRYPDVPHPLRCFGPPRLRPHGARPDQPAQGRDCTAHGRGGDGLVASYSFTMNGLFIRPSWMVRFGRERADGYIFPLRRGEENKLRPSCGRYPTIPRSGGMLIDLPAQGLARVQVGAIVEQAQADQMCRSCITGHRQGRAYAVAPAHGQHVSCASCRRRHDRWHYRFLFLSPDERSASEAISGD